MRRYLFLIAALTLVLSACRVESVITLDIESDGSALIAAELGYDEEFQQLLGDSGFDLSDLSDDLPDFGGDDIVQTERTEGDMTYVGVSAEVDDLSEFGEGQTAEDLFSSFSYTFDDDSASLDATVSSDALGDTGGEFPIDPGELTGDFFRAVVVVTMPGTVTQDNADEVRSDGALVWNIPLTGGDLRIQATSEIDGGGPSNLLIIALTTLLGLAIVAIVAATITNRRRSERAVAAAAAAHESSSSSSSTLEFDAAPPPSDSPEPSGDDDDGEDQPDST